MSFITCNQSCKLLEKDEKVSILSQATEETYVIIDKAASTTKQMAEITHTRPPTEFFQATIFRRFLALCDYIYNPAMHRMFWNSVFHWFIPIITALIFFVFTVIIIALAIKMSFFSRLSRMFFEYITELLDERAKLLKMITDCRRQNDDFLNCIKE